jgi:oligoendopeptidase F
MKKYPQTPDELLTWDWSQFEPAAHDLINCTLNADTVNEWLEDWSDFSAHLLEMGNRLYVATSVNTADTNAEKAYTHFNDHILPKSMEVEQALKQKLLESGLKPAGFDVALRNMRAEASLFRQENLELLAEEFNLSNEYDKIIGPQTVVWEGQEQTLTQLRPVQQEIERSRREQAWRLTAQRQLADRASLNDLWRRFLALRCRLAANAGKPDYRAYRWQQLLRFDYTPADCERFHEAIETVVVPACTRVYERRRQRLGLETLRPWDLEVDPAGRPPLHPYRFESELKDRASSMFHHVDPQLGAHFDRMASENLLDLTNRKNKAPGGYCTDFPVVRRPFIFMNGVGLHNDVQTLLHEGGHAFHVFESYAIRLMHLLQVPIEFAEVASMGMELLASPYLEERAGGFYSPEDAARALTEHLESALLFWPYMAVVDTFQHWVYENPLQAENPAACDAAWVRSWNRFMPGVDWSGLEDELATGWHRKLHIFTIPFYYVEYGIAQLGAIQVWLNAQQDQAAAVARYRQALALGGSVPLPQLFQAAGAKLAFDRETLSSAVKLIESRIVDHT